MDMLNPISGSKLNRAPPENTKAPVMSCCLCTDLATDDHPARQASSTSTPKARKDKVNPASGSKSRPVIYLKRGRGGKVGRGGRGGGRGSVPVANVSRAASTPRDDDVLSTSSGQTTSGGEEEG